MEENKIKEIDLQPGVAFQANGKTYIPSETFSIGRFEKVEELEEELLMFSEKRTCHEVMLAAMANINNYKPGEAYTLMYNKIESDQRSAKVTHYMLKLCAAYINVEGEDLRYLTDESIKAKIHDWAQEGFDVRPFLVFAIGVFRTLFDRYKSPIQHILTKAEEIKKVVDTVMDIKSLMAGSGPVQ